MAKNKQKQPGKGGMSNKHLHARVSYLHEASKYLADTRQKNMGTTISNTHEETSTSRGTDEVIDVPIEGNSGSQTYLISQVRAVALKSQVRLSRDVKHSICKRCSTLLILGSTSSANIENKSKGGKKPWANVRVITCLRCKAQKRFPIGCTRQLQKSDRSKATRNTENASGKLVKGDITVVAG